MPDGERGIRSVPQRVCHLPVVGVDSQAEVPPAQAETQPVDVVGQLRVQREDSLVEAAGILDAFRRMARVPYVVVLNRSSGIDQDDERRIRERLDLRADVALLPCDATDKESVKSVLLALLYAVLDEVEAERASV